MVTNIIIILLAVITLIMVRRVKASSKKIQTLENEIKLIIRNQKFRKNDNEQNKNI